MSISEKRIDLIKTILDDDASVIEEEEILHTLLAKTARRKKTVSVQRMIIR